MVNAMMIRKLIIFFYLISIYTYAQTNKSFDFGLCAPFSYNSKIPDFALSPNLNYCTGKHQFQIGVDIYANRMKDYCKNIIGPHFAYKYLFSDETKPFNVFGDFNLQYVQYGVGERNAVRYNYLPTDIEKFAFNLVQTKSLINTLGLGISVTFFKRASLIFVIGGGYNYYQSKNSSTSYLSAIYLGFTGVGDFPEGTFVKPIIYTRLGLNIKLWKNY